MNIAKIIPFPVRQSTPSIEPMNVQFPHTEEQWADSVLPHLRDAIVIVGFDAAELKARLGRMRAEDPEIVFGLIANWKATVEHLLQVIEVVVEAADRSESILKTLPPIFPASA